MLKLVMALKMEHRTRPDSRPRGRRGNAVGSRRAVGGDRGEVPGGVKIDEQAWRGLTSAVAGSSGLVKLVCWTRFFQLDWDSR